MNQPPEEETQPSSPPASEKKEPLSGSISPAEYAGTIANDVQTGATEFAAPESDEDDSAATKLRLSRRALICLMAAATVLKKKGRKFAREMPRIAVEAVLGEAVVEGAKSIFATDESKQVREGFVQTLNENRLNPDRVQVVGNEYRSMSRAEEAMLRGLQTVAGGDLLHLDDYLLLSHLMESRPNPAANFFLRDLLSSDRVRAANASEAHRIVSEIDASGLGEQSLMALADKQFSIAYTSLDRQNAVKPEAWRFDKAFETARTAGAEMFGVRFTGKNVIIDSMSIETIRVAASFNVKGFYVLMWSLCHWSAGLSGSELRDAAKIQMLALRTFAALKKEGQDFNRQIWNFSYILALQYHRQGKISDNSAGEFRIRNEFLAICVGNKFGWHGEAPTRFSYAEFKPSEIVPICAALFMQSTPDVFNRIGAFSVPTPLNLYRRAYGMNPSSALSAVDIIRKIGKKELSPVDTFVRHGAYDGTFGIYVERVETIRQGLLGK